MENKLNLSINHYSDVPKYQQLVNAFNEAIGNNDLSSGDVLPSVNSICKNYQLSRDTVFKAYTILKENGVIASVPNKGYFVSRNTKKVLLVLDTYKEVLYHSFVKNLPDGVTADIQFHHYNIENFKTIINNSIGKYYKYVVMNFDHSSVDSLVSKIPTDKLLLIDWHINVNSEQNYVCQNFGVAFHKALNQGIEPLKKYKKVVFVYPEFTNHPFETVTYFEKFCYDNNLSFEVITKSSNFKVANQTAYISVSDRILGIFLEQCREQQLEPGKDVGFLSYNETPMKQFIYKGISVVSTDFNELGSKAAEFISTDKPMQHYVPTNLILRESL